MKKVNLLPKKLRREIEVLENSLVTLKPQRPQSSKGSSIEDSSFFLYPIPLGDNSQGRQEKGRNPHEIKRSNNAIIKVFKPRQNEGISELEIPSSETHNTTIWRESMIWPANLQ